MENFKEDIIVKRYEDGTVLGKSVNVPVICFDNDIESLKKRMKEVMLIYIDDLKNTLSQDDPFIIKEETREVNEALYEGVTRKSVLQIIEDEREYQLQKEDTESSHISSSLNMGGILTAIQHNLMKAQVEWYGEKEPYAKTSGYLRKIAALCVKAGEDYGMSERVQ